MSIFRAVPTPLSSSLKLELRGVVYRQLLETLRAFGTASLGSPLHR
ncbi:hypothetical protein ACWATR_40145 [Nostoc sp. UIC 10890]